MFAKQADSNWPLNLPNSFMRYLPLKLNYMKKHSILFYTNPAAPLIKL